MKNIKTYNVIKLLPILLFAFLFFISISWFSNLKSNQFIYIHDQSPFLYNDEAAQSINVWSRNWLGTDGGMAVYSSVRAVRFLLLSKIALTIKQMEMVYFMVIFTTPAITMYLFLRKVLNYKKTSKDLENIKIMSAVLGSFLYSFNLYLIIIWHAGHYTNIGFLYALFPLMMLQLWDVLFNFKNPFIAGLLIGLLFLLTGPVNPPYLVGLVATSFLLFVVTSFFVSESNKFLNVIISTLTAAITAALVNLWWIIPNLKTILFSAQRFINSGDKSISYVSLIAEPPGLVRRMLLYMKWTFDGYWNGRYFHSFYPYYQNSAVILLWIVLFLFSFSCLFYINKIKKKEFKFISSFSFLLLALSMILAKGIQNPFSSLFIFLYKNVPFFNMFRSPGNKFGSGLVFSLSILLSLSVYFLLLKLKDKKHGKLLSFFLCIFISFAIFIYGYPLYTGIALKEIPQGKMPSNVTTIPEEYQSFAAFINSQNDDFRVLFLPGRSYGGYTPNNSLGLGYEGPDMVQKLINKPSVYRPSSSRTFKDAAEVLWKIYDDHNLELLRFLNVKYLVQRCDTINYDKYYNCEEKLPPTYGKYLNRSNDLKVFALYDEYYKPTISLANYVQTENRASEFFDEVKTGQLKNPHEAYFVKEQNLQRKNFPKQNELTKILPQVSFTKENNSRYLVSIHNSEGKYILVFSEAFHKDWLVFPVDKTVKNKFFFTKLINTYNLGKDTHYEVNAYANGWLIDTDTICKNISCHKNADGTYNFNIILEFWPNWLFYGGLLVSSIALISVSGILLFRMYSRNKQRKQELIT